MMTKSKFIENELIADSIHGAFQRANVYSGPKVPEAQRKELRERLAQLLESFAPKYCNPVSDQQHEANIRQIADDLTTGFRNKGLLRDDQFRIGVAQKALNLFLKYLWCLDKIPTPPHCPFDAGIIALLPRGDRQNWTELKSLGDYRALVNAARKVAKGESLSQWQLEHFPGRTAQ